MKPFSQFLKEQITGISDPSGRTLLERYRTESKSNKIGDKRAYKMIKEFTENNAYDPKPKDRNVSRETIPKVKPSKAEKSVMEFVNKVTTETNQALDQAGQNFEDFFRGLFNLNPNVSVTAAKKEFRRRGGKVGDKKAFDTGREVTGKEKDVKKMTRLSMVPRKAPVDFHKGNLIKKRYVFLMVYNVEDSQGQSYQRLIYVGVDNPSVEEAVLAVLDYWELEVRAGDDERYTEYEIDMDSIKVYKDKHGYAFYDNTIGG